MKKQKFKTEFSKETLRDLKKSEEDIKFKRIKTLAEVEQRINSK